MSENDTTRSNIAKNRDNATLRIPKNVGPAAKHREPLKIHQEERKPENEIDKECRESGNDEREDDAIPHTA